MRKLVFVFFVLSSMISFAQSGPKNFLDVNYIEVTGKSIKEITPDMIYMNLIINENDNKKVSIKNIEKKMMKSLKSIGVDLKKDLKLRDFASNFQSYFFKKTDVKLTKEYELIVHTGTMASNVLETLKSIGVANVSIAKLRYSKIKEVRLEAMIAAIKDAKKKATLLTLSIDQAVGKALYVREQGDYIEYPLNDRYGKRRPMMSRMNSATVSDQMAPQIGFQKIKLEYSVNVRFEIK
ncbi:MAG: SIMPL domain-containing protein [Marinifilaceae bacterium]